MTYLSTEHCNPRVLAKDIIGNLALWMELSGYSAPTVYSYRSILAQALKECFPKEDCCYGIETLIKSEKFLSKINELEDLLGKRVHNVLKFLSGMLADYKFKTEITTFSFTEINPGAGLFGLAAINCGGNPFGSVNVSPIARATFAENRGLGSLHETNVDVDIVLVNLPFSAFASSCDGDPAVNTIVRSAVNSETNPKCLLFRVDWTLAVRLGIQYDAYVDIVTKHFPKHTITVFRIENSTSAPMEGCELFILACSNHHGKFRLNAYPSVKNIRSAYVDQGKADMNLFMPAPRHLRLFPSQQMAKIYPDYNRNPSAGMIKTVKGIRRLSIKEIRKIFGLPQHFALPECDNTAIQLLADSIVVPVAERAIISVFQSFEFGA